MFTGIVEEIGIVKQIRNNSLGLDIDIQANEIFSVPPIRRDKRR